MAPKTTQKKILQVLQGKSFDIPPMWLMRQAGRYLPEYRAIRQQVGSFLDMCLNPDIATEITLQPIRRFDFDAAILFADILLVPYGLGQKLTFVEGQGPQLPPLRADQLHTLDMGTLPQRLAPVFKAIEQIRANLAPDKALIGFAGAPWTVACYIVSGQNVDEFAAAKNLLFTRTQPFMRLLEILVEATVLYLRHQILAGVEVIQLFDSWAGVTPPGWWDACIFQPTAKIVRAIRQEFPHIPIIGFPRGLSMDLVDYVGVTKVDALGLDTYTSAEWARGALKLPLQGNIDPEILVAGGAALETSVYTLLNAMKGVPHIFNLGHGILPQTPIEHVNRLVEYVRIPSRHRSI